MKKKESIRVSSKLADEDIKGSLQEPQMRQSRMETKIFRKRNTLSQSLLLENNYFTHDTKLSELMTKKLTVDQLDFLPICFVEWNWLQFIEFFCYHFVIP
jgi:hypothetical protein